MTSRMKQRLFELSREIPGTAVAILYGEQDRPDHDFQAVGFLRSFEEHDYIIYLDNCVNTSRYALPAGNHHTIEIPKGDFKDYKVLGDKRHDKGA